MLFFGNKFKNPLSMKFVLFLSFLVSFSSVLNGQDSSKTTTPNIVFMFADDLGYGDLACYGHPYAKTPALDQLAKEGTRFTRFYVSGVTCCPSRTGFMTGVHTARFAEYPAVHGFGDKVTVTELLSKKGYQIGHYGKWHIGPNKGQDYGVDEYGPQKKSKDKSRGRDAEVYDSAIEFIKRNAEQPFYLNIWGHISHYAVNAPDDQVQKLDHIKVDRADFSKTMQHKFDKCLQVGGNIDAGMREYLAEVQALDSHVKRVLDVLDELGLSDNTIVVFSSDHGPAPVIPGKKKGGDTPKYAQNMLGYAGELRGGKHSQYEGGVRAPFIIRWPGHVKAGRVDSTNILSGLDWLPTLCSIAGVSEVPDQLDGEVASAAWFGEELVRKKPLFWRTSSPKAAPSMLEGKWKLHLGSKRKDKLELYDLSADPSESENVTEQHPKIVEKLSRKMNTWLSQLPAEYKKGASRDLK